MLQSRFNTTFASHPNSDIPAAGCFTTSPVRTIRACSDPNQATSTALPTLAAQEIYPSALRRCVLHFYAPPGTNRKVLESFSPLSSFEQTASAARRSRWEWPTVVPPLVLPKFVSSRHSSKAMSKLSRHPS
ncbi:hypothetical protein HBI56_174440 [Parastagonospora nodorum]|uniref:Uncharacterized protein n=1 Tax=Phaeosphaeria nodorum (strain SN15 / ATCC MYA-4574 / FGSC 10173) TaxID=321614 RepID=A0A7U2I6U4_PHANO|nr:hypothetical protein HBH56_119910 [Parastagonospora nodorum]QRD04010.1 hypothetical protein JI435_138670 [Parastagonospora nodorum SN15]KAH3924177.1 hypothetical protein HBH54_195810 [Parastagonospora nodorum]KAH3956694.1 hypothetical protein HBH51_236690 [Parastagonospora nodorum]KAH3968428.1 hypothetical protein HBH52_178260 [Parastagonospora nodorum]